MAKFSSVISNPLDEMTDKDDLVYDDAVESFFRRRASFHKKRKRQCAILVGLITVSVVIIIAIAIAVRSTEEEESHAEAVLRNENLIAFWPMNNIYYMCDQTSDPAKFYSDYDREVSSFGSGVTFTKGVNEENEGALHFDGTPQAFIKLAPTFETKYGDFNKKLDLDQHITIATYIRNVEADGPILEFIEQKCETGLHFVIKDSRLFAKSFREYSNTCDKDNWDNPLSCTLSSNGWHFVALAISERNAADFRKLYIDGEMVNKTTNLQESFVTYTDMIRIGVHSAEKKYLKADLTCLMVFRKALNQDELLKAEKYCRSTRSTVDVKHRPPPINIDSKCSRPTS